MPDLRHDVGLLVTDLPAYQRLSSWTAYGSGVWTREAPTLPGLYAVATIHGARAGFLTVARVGSELAAWSTQRWVTLGEAWSGWWWSEPLPELPEPPAV